MDNTAISEEDKEQENMEEAHRLITRPGYYAYVRNCLIAPRLNPPDVENKNAFEALMENEKEIFAVTENQKKGRITVDSGAAESVWPESLLPEVETTASYGSRNGVTYITANGDKMDNKGEKKIKFKTSDGLSSSIIFQVTGVKKPLATVSKITQKENWVCFGPNEAYIHNVETGKRTKMDLINGTYGIDVEYITTVFSGLDP